MCFMLRLFSDFWYSACIFIKQHSWAVFMTGDREWHPSFVCISSLSERSRIFQTLYPAVQTWSWKSEDLTRLRGIITSGSMHSTHVYYILYILYTPQMCHKIMQVGNRKEFTLYLARGREQHEITSTDVSCFRFPRSGRCWGPSGPTPPRGRWRSWSSPLSRSVSHSVYQKQAGIGFYDEEIIIKILYIFVRLFSHLTSCCKALVCQHQP